MFHMKSILKRVNLIILYLSLFSVSLWGQTSLFFDDFNQALTNPVDSSGQPQANYSVWTTVTPSTASGGTALIEEYAAADGVIKLLACDDRDTQTGNRTEVFAPLSVYNAPFIPTLSSNTKSLEWTFTLKQNRNSAGGSNGFNGTQTGIAVVLAADTSGWGTQQGSDAKGYAVTLLKPNSSMYCVSLSRFDGGLSNYEVIAGNKTEDVFSTFKTWITVKVTYSPTTNQWELFFRDEESTAVKGDITNSSGLKFIDSTVDSTFTNIEMSHFGFALNTPTPSSAGGANGNALYVDDFAVNAMDSIAPKFTINTSNSSAGGTVMVEPTFDSFSFGSQVVVTAMPDDGFIFEKWTGDVSGFDNPATVIVNTDMELIANFIPEPKEPIDKKALIHYDEVLLEAVKEELGQNNAYFLSAYNALMDAADSELMKEANPVTNKTLVPPSGSKNDYLSLAPYWWPDLSKADSLPWIRKDGQVNPMTRGDNTDQARLSEFFNSLELLSFAYYFSDDTKYAIKAIDLLNIWLVNEATRMNPHANYAQGVPGSSTGRQIGIIEFGGVDKIVAATQILENKGILSESTKSGVDKWLSDWSVWLRTSAFGVEESEMGNNHGTWYDYQVLGLLLYEGDTVNAVKVLNDFKTKRLAPQIEPDGSQPGELARTKSVNYSTMNLWGMTQIAQMGMQVDVNLWDYETVDGRSIRKAYDFFRPYVLNPSSWTWEQITNGGAENALNTLTKPLFSKGSTIFREDLIPQSENAEENLSYLEQLIYPPRTQIYIASTGIQKNNFVDFKVFPNPSFGLFNIQVQEQVNYQLFTINGVLIDAGQASGSFVLDLGDSNNSISFLRIASKDKVAVVRLIKK